MSRDSSRDRTWLIPHAPADRPKQQPVSLEDLWPESRRSREVPALIDVALIPVRWSCTRPDPNHRCNCPCCRFQRAATFTSAAAAPSVPAHTAANAFGSVILLVSVTHTPPPKRANKLVAPGTVKNT